MDKKNIRNTKGTSANKNTNVKDNKKRKKKKSKVGKVFKVILLILLVALIIYGIWFAIQYNKHAAVLETEEVVYDPLSATALGIDPDRLKETGRINILLLGESGVGDGYKLTDSIMIVSYNPQTQQASILSIPRDTYVGKKDKDSASVSYLQSYKMNAAYRNGTNIEETVECVANLTGMDLENWILIDTDAIIDVVDAIGGVTFDVPIDMDYDDETQGLHIYLQAGEQLIDGAKAEQLLRFRHNNDGSSYPSEYGDNDLGRMRTQREFIQETARQLLRIENVTKVLDLLDIVFNKVQTNIEFETMKYYIPYIFKFNTSNIITDTLPGTPELCNGVWIYTADKTATQQVVEDLFTDRVMEEEPTEETNTNSNTNEINEVATEDQITIELLNGTDDKELLTKAKTALKEKGYVVTKTGTTESTSKTTIINRTKQPSRVTRDIETILGTGSSSSGSNNSNVDITITIGKDYE